MNKIRAAAVVVFVGVLFVVAGGVASATPPPPEPFADWPEVLRPLGWVSLEVLTVVLNFFAGVSELIIFGS